MLRNIFYIFIISGFFAAAAAQDEIKTAIGPQLGFQKASDANNGNLMYGAAVRVKLGQSLGFEASINYRQEDFLNDRLTVRSYPVMLTGMIYPVEVLYGAIGIGWYNTKFDFSKALNNSGIHDRNEQKFGWHFGAGLEIPLGKSGSMITTDFRYVFLNYDFEEVPGTGDTKANYFVITAGLLFGIN